MSNYRRQFTLAMPILLVALGVSVPAVAAAPDVGLYTLYSFDAGFVNVSWLVCGVTYYENIGCYKHGSLGPFGHVGALMESKAVTSGNTVTRSLYIVDVGTGTGIDKITMYVYRKVDTVSLTNDSTKITLVRKVRLPLVGGT